MEKEQQAAERKITRREFLTSSAMTTGLAASAIVAGSFGWRFVYQAVEIPKIQMLATALSKLPPGTRKVLKLANNEVVLINKDGKIRALSTVCTHLGCRAAWQEHSQQFVCPCHIGIFDADGKVVSGPPPQPLQEFAVEVKAGNIYVSVPLEGG